MTAWYNEDAAHAYERFSSKYASSNGYGPRFISKYLPVSEGTCLDVGHGQGPNTEAILGKGHTVIGVDISVPQLVRSLTVPHPVVACDARSLPFRSSTFAAATAGFLHTDVAPFEQVAREISRVLVPGAIFVYVGLHPCFVGPFVTERTAERVVVNRHYGSPSVAPINPDATSIRRYVPGWHLPLSDLVRCFLAAGFAIEAMDEDGRGAAPWVLAFRLRKIGERN